MTDLQGALETRLYERLAGSITGAAVYQHAPQDVQGDLVIIGAIDSSDAGAKGVALRLFSVDIATEVKATGRKELNALQAQVAQALDDWRPASTEAVSFGAMMFGATSGALGADGATYFGSQQYTIFVQPI